LNESLEANGLANHFGLNVADIALNSDYRDLLIALADARADFLLIGGWALALHGYGRGTDDMDVFVRPTPENAERVFKALVEFGAPVAAHGVTAGLFANSGYGYRMGIRPNLIEMLTSIDGVTFEEAQASRQFFELEGRQIPYISRAILLKNKRAAGRAKDLADVEWLVSHPSGNQGSTR
jgi:hypothetical protein